MRNDYGNRPRAEKAKGGRTGKQFGGGLINRPLAGPLSGARTPVRPLGYKHGGKASKGK